MSKSSKDIESDDINDERASLMRETTKGIEIPEIPMCGFLSVRYYQPYFDVDSVEIIDRIMQATLFCRREKNFLTLVAEKPDAYGPFWISTTLIFLIAVASQLNGWFSSWIKGMVWVYNFQTILTASSLVYGFAFITPMLLWFIFKHYEVQLRIASVLCLYGYSLFVYIPAVILCSIPSQTICWSSLFIATVLSSLLLLRNLAPFIVNQANNTNTTIILSFVGLIQLSFMFSLKLNFFASHS